MAVKAEIFIGSSSEGLSYAKVIQDVITSYKGYLVRPWPSAFRVGESYIESLINAAERVSAAIFVATPDDRRVMRRHSDSIIRDNVLFEYGLFSGKLGRSRTALAVIGDAVGPSDLRGVTHISLPIKKKADQWGHYKENFVDRKIREWLQTNFETQSVSDIIAAAQSLTYKVLESERVARNKGLFTDAARKSSRADYLVLRGRTLLSDRGEIALSINYGHPSLRVRLLMLDFTSLTNENFNEMKSDMDLDWEEALSTEKRLAKARLAFARDLSERMALECRLLPASKIPEIKLRLYEHCGFFGFYRKIGKKKPVQERTVFYVADDRSAENERSPLLGALKKVYDDLWESARPAE